MKWTIFICWNLGWFLGSWVGATFLDHGNILGGWSIILTAVGSFGGIWVGYRLGKTYF